MQKILEDRYEVLGELGGGAFSQVLKARQLSTGKLVAVKLLLPERLEDNDNAHLEVQRFEREMKLVARLKHPNIVPIIDSGSIGDDRLYLVFDYVEGESLEEVLESERRLDPEEARALMLQVIDALSAAHELGIVHRDLKPANIMLAKQGLRRRAYVLDFGLSALVEDRQGKDYVQLTLEGIVPGTPYYMAPEQLQMEPLSPRSDIYAWGLVLYECLVGERPYKGRRFMQIVRAQLSDEPVPIPDWLLVHDVGPILEKVLQKDSDARYQNASDLFADLNRCTLHDLNPPPLVEEADEVEAPAPAETTPEEEDSEAEEPADAVLDLNALSVIPAESSPIKSGYPQGKVVLVVGALGLGILLVLLIVGLTGEGGAEPEDAESSAKSAGLDPESLEGRCIEGDAEACFDVGQARLASEDYSDALPRLEDACEAGLTGSCTVLALALEEAPEPLRAPGRALELLAQACQKGEGDACFHEGERVFDGRIGPADPEQGAKLFDKACALDQAAGCYRLGISRLTGKGSTVDKDAALALLELSCTQGYAKGCERLASAYRRGRLVDKDHQRQFEYNSRACELKSGDGCLDAAQQVEDGRGMERSLEEALAFRDKACEQGALRGCYEGCHMVLKGRGAEKSAVEAARRCQQGCDGDDAASCFKLAEIRAAASEASFGDGDVQKLLTKACEGGLERACDKMK